MHGSEHLQVGRSDRPSVLRIILLRCYMEDEAGVLSSDLGMGGGGRE